MEKPEVYALITGGSMGIGKAIAHDCASRGMNLLLVALPGKELEETANEIAAKFNVLVHTFAVDLAMIDGPELVYKWCVASDYKVNVLVNNAGLAGSRVFKSSELAYTDTRIMVNIRAMALLSQLFIPLLEIHPKAYILNIASMAAYFSIPYKAVYAASKAFVLSFSQALSSELAQSNISVSVVCPNGVETNSGTFTRIKAHGFFGNLTKIEANILAKVSINGMLNRKEVIIPKRINRFLLVINLFLPGKLRRNLIKKRFLKEVNSTTG
ncbi:MAG: SDR family NAD(P)-dependent oxidoreductase [Bacteroidales bacterium]|nr:SDR family NAD(P)-dependent oxidoreductase [Bacteroidales bacterium]